MAIGAGSLAPELGVEDLGGRPASLAGLAKGGPALLLFVSEECPTSALALRRLGPLVGGWAERGLAAAAVFQDPPEVAARVARRLGWGGSVLSEAAPYATSRAYGLESVPTAVLVDAEGAVAASVVGWDREALTELVSAAGGLAGAELEPPPGERPTRKPGCSSKSALDPALVAAMAGAGGLDEMEDMFERGWTDGLPVVPPTPERVAAMLAGRDPASSLGRVPPAMGEATLERVASCAVLAGCRPAYFPVVVAAVEAALDPAFNLHGQAVTTQPVGQLVVVNGPVRAGIGLNSGMGALGPGWRANATIGRALRLVVTLTGGGAPGRLDRSTLGQPGKLSACLAEDEETSPWEPLHVERGYSPRSSVVTLVACDAPLSISEHRSRTPEDLAWVLGWAAASAWSTNWWPLEGPSLYVICPEHAAMFAGAGWGKDRLRQAMFDAVSRPARELRRGETTPAVHASDPEAPIRKWRSPESIMLVVAGGEAGRFSAVLGPCSGMGAGVVSREVAWST